ncbi:MAG: double-strand break repair protein AddB [Erythrobacter sp.]|uniref:double-strand break repair protein AddB n=1 Tax=Erythrobacter sp. TaxID=1042 RepID=UPI0026242686|nr:double-strand break repair protein AddB [Erythrobacter sp.]MDJ0977386.1 double-strand break repair protein AddB [Erythrobacter sp.]
MSAADPQVYSIAAHRGFADALVAGIVPRYWEPDLGLARLTLLVPSARAARTISEAFTRYTGEVGKAGLLMPRLVTVGDLDLDEALGALLDPLGASDIPPAVEPTRRWLDIARLIEVERAADGLETLPGAARMRLAREMARTMDRLLVEGKTPDDLVSPAVVDTLGDLSRHWQRSIALFARVQARWLSRLEERGEVDAATRRNLLFDRARRRWRENPPQTPIIAAGVTSASPALARMLRTIADLPEGAVILPDLDLAMDDAAWEELGRGGAAPEPGGEVFGKSDALTHPQYHLKLLLERMGVAREEVRPWHRKGLAAAEPARSRAISSLFLPAQASKSWVTLETDRRRLPRLRTLTAANSEEEAQAIALMVREALEEPGKRVAVVSADRGLARRVTQHLRRWNVEADDSAGQPLSLTAAGRLFALLAEVAGEGMELVSLIAALGHPLVASADTRTRGDWLMNLRTFERYLRGPAPAPGLAPMRRAAAETKNAGVIAWWEAVEAVLTPLADLADETPLAQALDRICAAAEALAGEAVWAREDGRALARMVEDTRLHAGECATLLAKSDIATVLRDTMAEIAVRPPYGGHPRVAVYGLLESRMARADLVICGGLNEGTWPQTPSPDALLAPAILRALGVPGAEFRIGLAAHDLAGAMGAPDVVLTRSQRDADGPTRPSRFVLRVEALLGEKEAREHRETRIGEILPRLDRAPPPAPSAYPRPAPNPSAALRNVAISATALDQLLGDPYQFYAKSILNLRKLNPLAADPFVDPALRGTLVHKILDQWHRARVTRPDLALVPFAQDALAKTNPHPLFWGLWRPRILAALARFEERINLAEEEGRRVALTETWGAMDYLGVRVFGQADRVDRLPDATLGIVDYKTGAPPSKKETAAGYRLQLGVLGLIARHGGFKPDRSAPEASAFRGEATAFEYWSLRKKDDHFGEISVPMKLSSRERGLEPEEFLPLHEAKLTEAITDYITGAKPFTAKENPDYPGYTDYDQLMRLEEWIFEPDAKKGLEGA